MNTAIALAVFNRPDITESVFEAIAQARPSRLFVFADGPRSPAEAELCERARAVVEEVDWDCDVKYDYSDENLGCKRRITSGIDWVFSHVDEAIILEDDCVPDPTFFPFCAAMLARYRDDPRIMMITGSNYVDHWKEDRQSYHLSHLGSVWGWASWKRAWDFYDVAMAAWGNDDIKAQIRDLIANEEIYQFQSGRFDRLHADVDDRHCWDLQWIHTRLVQSGLTVVPALNLISNRGNTDGRGLPAEHPLANLPVSPVSFPLVEPPAVAVDRAYDEQHVRRQVEWWDLQARRREQERVRSRSMHRRVARKLRRVPSLVSKKDS